MNRFISAGRKTLLTGHDLYWPVHLRNGPFSGGDHSSCPGALLPDQINQLRTWIAVFSVSIKMIGSNQWQNCTAKPIMPGIILAEHG
jgi:hypothetical protein